MRPREYLSEKLSNFNQMKILAENQVQALAENDDLDRFFDLLKQREHLRSQMMAYDRNMRRTQNKARIDKADQINTELQDQINKTITTTLKCDRQIEELIGQRREKLLADIKDLRQGHKALKGYGSKANANLYHIDKLG
jgi:GTPase involved in cell partitioning and DNA repair